MGSFLGRVIVAAHTANNLDLGSESEGCADTATSHFGIFVPRIEIKNFSEISTTSKSCLSSVNSIRNLDSSELHAQKELGPTLSNMNGWSKPKGKQIRRISSF